MSIYSLDRDREDFIEHSIGPHFRVLGVLCKERDNLPHTPSEMAEIWSQIAEIHQDVRELIDAKIAENTLLSLELRAMRTRILGLMEQVTFMNTRVDSVELGMIEVHFDAE